MAADVFIKIDTVKGDSIDKDHKEEIEILSWSWGMTQNGSTHMSTGGGAGKVNVQDLTLTKYVDRSTPILIQACCTGKHFKNAVLTVRKAGEKPLEYLKITVEDLIISAVTTGGQGGKDLITENVSLNFARFKVEYTPQGTKGEGTASIPVAFDIAKNTLT